MVNSFHIAELIQRELTGKISPEELQELEVWKQESPQNLSIYEKARDSETHLSKLDIYQLFNKEKVWKKVENELYETKTIQLFSKRLLKYAASIVLPLVIAGSLLFYFINQNNNKTGLANIDEVIKPGTQKAVLILSDGGTVDLAEEKIIRDEEDDNTEIKNENNILVYEEKKEKRAKKKLIFNELKTPRGGGYNLTLADGTKVWLNAGTSIKFPLSFSDSIRQVYLQGEAYFGVMPGDVPFIVSTNEMDVRVLGTSFNVSAYEDDSETKTTLVEGKVKIKISTENENNPIERDLIPNKQLVLDKAVMDIEVKDVNTDHYTSWVKGKLEFNNEDLEQVMKKLARWYDFEYQFDNEKSKVLHFTASFERSTNITDILNILEMTTNVDFEYKNNTLVIL